MMEALSGYTIGQSKAQWREDTGVSLLQLQYTVTMPAASVLMAQQGVHGAIIGKGRVACCGLIALSAV
jgi:hypothetical protein